MDISIPIAIILGLANGRRAAAKGYNRTLWTFLSSIAFIMLEVAALLVMMFALYGDHLLNNPFAVSEVLEDFAVNMTWSRGALLLAVGFGGYLLIRYIIERMPENINRNSNTTA